MAPPDSTPGQKGLGAKGKEMFAQGRRGAWTLRTVCVIPSSLLWITLEQSGQQRLVGVMYTHKCNPLRRVTCHPGELEGWLNKGLGEA
jgi:hypothetical protein